MGERDPAKWGQLSPNTTRPGVLVCNADTLMLICADRKFSGFRPQSPSWWDLSGRFSVLT